ncbi:MAG: phospholipase D-like domain-containing protein, partial [Chloroflexi bacterium]|nr:phospholipase D-like domain-containing protein [Chloroflexota bacterium]
MQIPYVIDNRAHILAEILNGLLSGHAGKSLDVASAYFSIHGYRLLKEGLHGLGNFRLILGGEPRDGEEIGLRPGGNNYGRLLRKELEDAPFNEEILRLIEDLTAFLCGDHVSVRLFEAGFLHAKCWLFYNDPAEYGWERFSPVAGIVGSSNFTAGGLVKNKELNLAHKTLLSMEEVLDDLETPPSLGAGVVAEERYGMEERRILKSSVGARAIAELSEWFDRQWEDSRDYKNDLIELLNESKFGNKEYSPYQVYIKALYECFKDELEGALPSLGTVVDLAEFQEDAVKKARSILARYDGVMVADSVGLGKTWIAKRLLEDYAYHMRQKALVICPASLRKMWDDELKEASISASILSQEELGQEGCEAVEEYGDADIIVIDESHNFRNRNTQRYDNLDFLINLNSGRGKAGEFKKIILLTATPINNDLMDLYSQLKLFIRGDESYFAPAGIGNLRKYIQRAGRMSRGIEETIEIFNLLEEVVIRRTRPFIKAAYPEATIKGQKIHFPERKLKTVTYNLEATYQGIYEMIVSGIESLKLAPYNLESYKKEGIEVDEFEQGRQQGLVGIFKSRFLKR